MTVYRSCLFNQLKLTRLLEESVVLYKIIVLRISDNDGVDLNGIKLHSTSEVADTLEKISSEIRIWQFLSRPPIQSGMNLSGPFTAATVRGFRVNGFAYLSMASLWKPDMKLDYFSACPAIEFFIKYRK